MSQFTVSAIGWLETILEERFGHVFSLTSQTDTLQISLPGSDEVINFDQLQSIFHESRSDFSCYNWQASKEGYRVSVEDSIPAPLEKQLPSPLIEFNEKRANIHYDILGLTYWMLTRLEEVGRTDLDNYQRFSAISSHAFLHGYLERPIVDEWLSILGQVIQRVWPRIELKKHQFSIKVSHDVDSPSLYGFKPWSTIGRMMAGHLLKRRNLKAFFTAPYVKLSTFTQLHKNDPFNTFEWLMNVSESNNLKSAFYFISGRTNPEKDSDYELEHSIIRNLMKNINRRGHEIGLHPSYDTFRRPDLLKKEADRLRLISSQEGIEQTQWGGRMHYLRWEQPTTLRAWANADMNYDSTLGYADRPGFRCGTCHEYPAFDPVAQESLPLRIRPLVVMECSVIDSFYLGLGLTEAAQEKMQMLKERCRQVSGIFTFLWHNSSLNDNESRLIFSSLLS